MANIKPFKALRPQTKLAKLVASRPYDVLSSAEAKIEAQGNPASFLHITKSEIDLPDTIDVHAQEVYNQAKSNLQASIQRDTLFRESKECYYIYQLIMNGRSQTGLVCISSVDDYENGIIKKHEFTRPEKELDRNNSEIDSIIEKWKTTKSPGYDFTADDGIQHTIWIISDGSIIDQISTIFANQIPCTYIADGHHRAASASKVRLALGDEATDGSNYFLTTLFPANDLHIMDYNRVVKDLNGLSVTEFLKALENKFTVNSEDTNAFRPANLHEIGLYVDHHWYKLVAKEDSYNNDPIGILDVTILQDNVLSALLNINDPRTDTRVDFVGGIRGLAELEKRVDSGEMAAAFSIYPVSMDQLFDIADSGKVMPPKSTWFEPKLRDGLLTHLIYE